MFRLVFFASISFFMCSCGLPQPFYNGSIPHEIDPYFNQFINRFQEDAKTNDIELGDIERITVIKFDDDESHYTEKDNPFLAECTFVRDMTDNYSNFHKEILIKSKIKEYNLNYQYKVFLHEIGHCAYNLPHSTQDGKDGIMYPIIDGNLSNFPIMLYLFFLQAKQNKNNWFSDQYFN